MSGAPAVPTSASEDLLPDSSPIGRLASGAFAGATGVFLAAQLLGPAAFWALCQWGV